MKGEETFTCSKCGKLKKETEGSFEQEGKKFCCENCCGKPEKGKPLVCEFC